MGNSLLAVRDINHNYIVVEKRNYMVKNNKHTLWYGIKKEWKRDWIYYVMCLPVVIYMLVNNYYPMYGITLAFKNYNTKLGIMGSPWVGFKYFKQFFSTYHFGNMIRNTLGISLYSLAVGFTIPIIFALMLN